MRLFARFIAISVLMLSFMVMLPAHADNAVVTDCVNFTGVGSMGEAIITAHLNGGGTITFACGGPATITFPSQQGIGANIIIDGANQITLSGGGTTRLFSMAGVGSILTLRNITVISGNANAGGAIYVSSEFVAENVTFSGNNANGLNGGAIRNFGTTTITNSRFISNTATQNGGAIANDGTLTINTSQFSGNNAENGGAIFNFGTLTINTSEFDTNFAEIGGAVFNDNTATITVSTFTSNSTTLGNGGAIQHGGVTLSVSDSTFTGNSSSDRGGGIRTTGGNMTLVNNVFRNNTAVTDGGSLSTNSGVITSQNTHYENGNCVSAITTITDVSGNTATNATGCPGTAPIPLSVSALTCNNDSAVFEILTGDADFSITGTGNGLPINPAAIGLYGLVGPATWTNIIITELRGDRQSINIGGITCPGAVIIPPSAPVTSTATVLGCALDSTDGVDVANAPDNTYCRVLMKNGGVVSYSGAVPADLIGLGVILAVDVYRLQGGASVNTFPDYARVCLSGAGRLFYMDGRNAPRYAVEMPTEQVDSLTCAWIPAPGTLILTN